MSNQLTLSLHLNSFPHNSEKSKIFHIVEVHEQIAMGDHDFQHRELHLGGPQHGFKKGVVKA